MAKDISINEFANEVVGLMKTYTTDVEEAINDEVKKIGDETANELKQVTYPSGVGGTANQSERRTWEEYARTWTNAYDEKHNYTSSTIHNKKHWQLTHLLEYGHATRDGKTRTREFPHIKPIADKTTKELLQRTKKIIEKGGKL